LDEEIGDLLFAVVNLARKRDIDPEGALRRATAKFTRRFQAIEAKLAAAGRSSETQTLDVLEDLWRQVKAEEQP
jgi:uncharacterized protein YabN with tetrapyrrole methylase and pyrophosphatase domain